MPSSSNTNKLIEHSRIVETRSTNGNSKRKLSNGNSSSEDGICDRNDDNRYTVWFVHNF